MRHAVRNAGLRIALTALGLALATLVGSATPDPAAQAGLPLRPLRTAVFEGFLDVGTAPLAFQRMSLAGATAVRLFVGWGSVAPAVRPANFVATNPSDPAYDWSSTDTLVGDAVAAGLDPIVCVVNAPTC